MGRKARCWSAGARLAALSLLASCSPSEPHRPAPSAASTDSNGNTQQLTPEGFVFDNDGSIIVVQLPEGPPGRTYGIHVDDTHVYWLEIANDVFRISKSGGPAERIGDWDGSSMIEGDAEALYWLSPATQLNRYDKRTGALTTREIPPGFGSAAILLDEQRVYLFGHNCSYRLRIPKDGSEPRLDDDRLGEMGGGRYPAFYGDRVFCGNLRGIRTEPRAGGTLEYLILGQNNLGAMVAVDGYLYWADLGDLPTDPSFIRRVPVGGGSPEDVVRFDNGRTGNLHYDEQRETFYWVSAFRVLSFQLGEAEPHTLVARPMTKRVSAMDEDYVYWPEDGSIRKISKDR